MNLLTKYVQLHLQNQISGHATVTVLQDIILRHTQKLENLVFKNQSQNYEVFYFNSFLFQCVLNFTSEKKQALKNDKQNIYRKTKTLVHQRGSFGSIQIIPDILGGVDTVSLILYKHFETLFLMVLKVKRFE